MCQQFFKLLYLVFSIISIIIISLFFSGQTLTREPPSNIVSSDFDATSSGNMSKMWPFKMEVDAISYVCNTPSPNFDVAEESLTAFWYLPPKTRLSPIMRQIGRCELASKEMASKGITFDTSNCRCISSWPVFTIVAVLFCGVFNLCRLIFSFSIEKIKNKVVHDFRKLIIAYIPLCSLCIALLVIIFNGYNTGFGMSYTLYGHVYPKSYYSESADWDVIFTLIHVSYWFSFSEFCLVFIGFLWATPAGQKMKAWVLMPIIATMIHHNSEPPSADVLCKSSDMCEIV